MDSVTQLVLGGVVAHAIGGKTLGKKALVWGAIIGTMPDLDVITTPFLNEMQQLLTHRSHTHAFFWQTVFAPIIAYIIYRIHKPSQHYCLWLVITMLVLYTHSIIDWFTVYGTQLLQPFSNEALSIGNMFIIDLIAIIFLLIPFLIVLFKQQVKYLTMIGLLLFSSYCLAGWQIQQIVTDKVQLAFKQQNIAPDKILVAPLPFSILWWRVVAVDENNWYEAEYRLWRPATPISIRAKNRNLSLLEPIKNSASVKILQWFSIGFYKFDVIDTGPIKKITFTNLRMGYDNIYFFRYDVAHWLDNKWIAIEPAVSAHNAGEAKWQEEVNKIIEIFFYKE